MVTSRHVETEVGSLFVEEHGRPSGPAVLLWPSLYCAGSMWRAQIAELANTYRVLVLDPPGHGRSGRPPARFSMADTAEATMAVLDAFGIRSVTMVGSAWGGMVGVQLAATVPERVHALVMINSPMDRWRGFQRAQLALLTALIGLAGPRPVEPLITRAMLSRRFRVAEPDRAHAFAADLRSFGRRGLFRAVRSVMLDRPSLLPLLGGLTVPVLAIAGAEDQLWTVRRARAETATIPDLRFEVVPGTAHLSAYEDPAAVNRLVIEFLDTAADPTPEN